MYPSQEVSPEWESTIAANLISFFKEKDVRGDTLDKMLAKELAKQKKKIETISDLYTTGKVFVVYYQKDFDSAKKEIHLTKEDFAHLEECIEISDGLFFEIQSQRNWFEMVCAKWHFTDFYDPESNKITFYGGMKYFCNKTPGSLKIKRLTSYRSLPMTLLV